MTKQFKLPQAAAIGLFLGALIGFGSCKKPQNSASVQGLSQKIVYEEILQPSVNLSELFNAYEVIILDDAEGMAMFGDVTKVMEANNKMVIFDNEIASSIFVYDKQGNFIFKTNEGEGPTETLLIEVFCIDETNNQLVVLDNGAMSIKFYDLANGEFVKSIKLNDHHFGISSVNGTVWLKNSLGVAQSKYDNAKLIALKHNGNEDDFSITNLPLMTEDGEEYTRYVAGDIAFLKSGSQTFYAEGYGHKIYSLSIDDGTLLNTVEIDFGKDGFHNVSAQIKSERDLPNIRKPIHQVYYGIGKRRKYG